MIPLCFAYPSRNTPHKLRSPERKWQKKRPLKQGRKSARYHSAFNPNLTAGPLLGFKSLSDVTVAPVVPTHVSTHCSQNELRQSPRCCLAPTASSLKHLLWLLFLLQRICHMELWMHLNTFSSACQALLCAWRQRFAKKKRHGRSHAVSFIGMLLL